MIFSINVYSLLQDGRYNQYLVVEPSTKLLRVIKSEDFENSTSQFLTWFIVCDYNTLEHFGAPFICLGCSICLAGFPDKRLFYDRDYNIAMLLPKSMNTNRHFEIAIDISYVHFIAENKVWLSCSEGDLLLQESNFEVNCEHQCTMLRMIQLHWMLPQVLYIRGPFYLLCKSNNLLNRRNQERVNYVIFYFREISLQFLFEEVLHQFILSFSLWVVNAWTIEIPYLYCPKWSTTPIAAMGRRQCSPVRII